jgi:uncharacterized caspase-like protein
MKAERLGSRERQMTALPQMHAMIIGNGTYDNNAEFTRLEWAPNDANRVFKLLTASETSLFNQPTSRCQTDVSLPELDVLLADFFAPIQRSHLALFYFAGHARIMSTGKRLFLIMRNSNPSALASSAFTVDRLIAYFDEKRLSRYVVILDCCYAQRALKSPGVRSRGAAPEVPSPEWSGQGKLFIAGTGEYQLAHELDKLEHGIFSFYFAKGIETGQAADPSKRWINVLDLSAYVGQQIAANHPDLNQEPVVSGEDITGELIIAKNRRFQPEHAHHAEILEYIKRSLELSELSDKDKIQAARIRKLRTFMDLLIGTVSEKFQQLQIVVLDHAEALGLDEAVAKVEYDAFVAKLNFRAAAPVNIAALELPSRGRALLFSTAYGKMALESPDLGSGLFSYYFREALSGAASNSDGVVTLSSAFNYLLHQVHGYEHFAQSPVLVSNVSHDPILTGQGIAWRSSSGRRVALLAGVNQYTSPELTHLRYAESDVERLASILQNLGGFQCTVLIGSNATKRSITEGLFRSLQELSGKDFFLFYFTGHGFSAENDGYAMLLDSNHRAPASSLRLSELSRLFEQSRVGLTVAVFDACMAPNQLPELS